MLIIPGSIFNLSNEGLTYQHLVLFSSSVLIIKAIITETLV